MAFTRRQINKTSTFQTGDAVVTQQTPSFTKWTNTTDTTGNIWNLGYGWSMKLETDGSQLSFLKGTTVALKFTEFGLDGQSNIDNLYLTERSTFPVAGSYNNGSMINVDGEIYMRGE